MDDSHSVRRGQAGRRASAPFVRGAVKATYAATALADADGRPPALRIAIVDSDSGFLLVLAKRLERLDWQHETLALRAAAERVAALALDVLIVDLASLGAGRWDWLQRLLAAEPSFGVIVCTGASTVAERVRALRLGADDWLRKPCHPEELIARVENVARARREPEPRSLEPVVIGEVEIRPNQFQAFVGELSLELTRREFQLIELLAAAGGEVIARETIYERLWGYEMARNDRSVDVFVHKLRRKLQVASPSFRYIQTEFRIGYRLAAVRDELPEPVELPARRSFPVPLAA